MKIVTSRGNNEDSDNEESTNSTNNKLYKFK